MEVVDVAEIVNEDRVRARLKGRDIRAIRVPQVDLEARAHGSDEVGAVDCGQGVDQPVTEVVVRHMVDPAALRAVRGRDVRVRGALQQRLRRSDVPRQLRMSRPEQRDDADHVRAGHRGSAERRVGRVARVRRRARGVPRSGDVGLDAAGAVGGDRAAAAEAGEAHRARIHRGGREGRRVDRRRILNGAAVRAAVARRGLDEDAGGLCVLDDRLERGRRTAFARRTRPAVVHHVRAERRVGVLTLEVGRCDEELEALRVGRRGAVPLIHVPAADPLRARRDTDLVTRSVVTGGGARRVRSVANGRRRAPCGPGCRCRRRCGSSRASCSCGRRSCRSSPGSAA